jgi:lysozyme family protein
MSDFDHAFEQVISIEGGYSNDPKDPGGETNFGISKRSYPDVDIKNLTLDGAKEIYKRDFWDKIKGDQMPFPLNMYLFDAGVNQGVTPAIMLLQKTLGVAQDGIFGVNTVALAKKMSKDALAMYLADRTLRYMGTRNADLYLRGWIKRLFIISMGVV